MIVKNEEANLARCFAGVKAIADEIIVVDTGSTDRTAEIARSLGATVVSSPWRNDFSQARNVSIEHATCAWILWLDADDTVPPQSVGPINELKRLPADAVFTFWVRNQKPGGTGSDFVQARMFPNRPDVRFERRIHEQISLSALRAGLRLVQKDVLIEHHGYGDPSAVREKARRNVEMLLTEYDAARPDPVMAVELADAYGLLGEGAHAERWYRAALDVPDLPRIMPDIAGHAHFGLGKTCNDNGRFGEALDHLDKALAISPDRPDVLYSMAVALERLGRVSEAIARLRRIVQLQEKPLFVSVDLRESRIKAYLRMERLLCLQRDPAESLRSAREAVQRLPLRPEIHSLLGRALLRTGKLIDALHAFEESLRIASEGNFDAFAGLCFVYVRAARAEAADATIARIKPACEHQPRFWALRRILLGLPPDAGIDASKVREEEDVLRLLFTTSERSG